MNRSMRCPIQTKLNNLIGFSLFFPFSTSSSLTSLICFNPNGPLSQPVRRNEIKWNDIHTHTSDATEYEWSYVRIACWIQNDGTIHSRSETNWKHEQKLNDLLRSQLLSDWTDEDHIHETHAASTVHLRIQGQAMRTQRNIVWWWGDVHVSASTMALQKIVERICSRM